MGRFHSDPEGSGDYRIADQRLSKLPVGTTGWRLVLVAGSHAIFQPVSGTNRWLPWVILVIGAQKIVSDVPTGMRRIYEYCYPLEDVRARRAYGVPSGVNNILIINKAITARRVTAIIVKERLGF